MDRESAPTQAPAAAHPDDPAPLRELHTVLTRMDREPPLESLHDAAHFLSEAQAL